MDRDLAKKKPTKPPTKKPVPMSKRKPKPVPTPMSKPQPVPAPMAPTSTKDFMFTFTPGGVQPNSNENYFAYWEIYKDGVQIANGNSAYPSGNSVKWPNKWYSAPAVTLSQGTYTLKYDCGAPSNNSGNSFRYLLGSDEFLLQPSTDVCPAFSGYILAQSATFTVV